MRRVVEYFSVSFLEGGIGTRLDHDSSPFSHFSVFLGSRAAMQTRGSKRQQQQNRIKQSDKHSVDLLCCIVDQMECNGRIKMQVIIFKSVDFKSLMKEVVVD